MSFKKITSLVLTVIFCAVLFAGCGGKDENPSTTATDQSGELSGKSIVVAGGNENFGYWQNLKKGAEEAAKKYGYSLTYVGTDEDKTEDVVSHISALEKVIDENVSGVVLSPVGEGYYDILSGFYDKKISVVQIDSVHEEDVEKLESNRKNPIVSTVSTDYTDAGTVCAVKMFEALKNEMEKSEQTYVIGVLMRENSEIDRMKADGFEEKFSELADANIELKGKYTIVKKSGNKYTEMLDELTGEEAKAVFLTNSDMGDEISDKVFSETSKYGNIIFCGFDSGAKQLNWLNSEEIGVFIGGVAQNCYDLGYNAVEQCILACQGKEIKPEITVKGEWYDKSNAEKMKQDNLVFEK